MKPNKISQKIGQRSILFLKDERELTPEEEEYSKKKWAELNSWVAEQEWFKNRKRRNV